jgi:hypothetical protein
MAPRLTSVPSGERGGHDLVRLRPSIMIGIHCFDLGRIGRHFHAGEQRRRFRLDALADELAVLGAENQIHVRRRIDEFARIAQHALAHLMRPELARIWKFSLISTALAICTLPLSSMGV